MPGNCGFKVVIYYDVDDTNQVVNVLRIIEKGRDTTPEQKP